MLAAWTLAMDRAFDAAVMLDTALEALVAYESLLRGGAEAVDEPPQAAQDDSLLDPIEPESATSSTSHRVTTD